MKKLNLNDLKVESFVTSLENQEANTLKGGLTPAATVGVVTAGAVVAAAVGVAVAVGIVAVIGAVSNK